MPYSEMLRWPNAECRLPSAGFLALPNPDCYLDSILLRFLSSNYWDYFPV